jgi:hypothetical protein
MKVMPILLLGLGIGIFLSASNPPPAPACVETECVVDSKDTESCSDLDYLFGEKQLHRMFEDHFSKSATPNFSHPLIFSHR